MFGIHRRLIHLSCILVFAIGTMLASFSASADGLNVEVSKFGTAPNGETVMAYTLSNRNDMQVTLITYGARIQSLRTPDEDGNVENIALGFEDVSGYLDKGIYFGATIGRYANRIAGGQFTLNGETYTLPKNNGPNTLHGGPEGFHAQNWEASVIKPDGAVGVEFTYLSQDGEMGFPGDLVTTVRYTLNNANELRIHYSAVSTRDTVVNLTNHVYLNLTGAGSGDILDALLMVNADTFSPVDETLIPLGEPRSVEDTPFDFTEPTAIGARIRAGTTQLMRAEPKHGGYDHNWILNTDGLNQLAARVIDPESGRVVEMYTTQPGVQVYTSNFLTGEYTGINGDTYRHWGAFTLETQHFPDSPNHPSFPSTKLEAGEKFTSTTIYKFLPM